MSELFGFTNTGRLHATQFQLTFGLTDRADGTVYYLKAQISDERLLLDSVPHDDGRAKAVVFPAFEGPMIRRTGVRLFVREGRLGYEVTGRKDISFAPIRPYDKTFKRTSYELKLPSSGFTGTEGLVYETQP